MKKFLSLLFVALLALTMIPSAMAEDVTLEFWTWRPEDVAFYDEMIANFEAENPGIKVNQTPINNTEYFTVLAAAMANNSGPDVFQMKCYGQLQTYSDSGYLADLTGKIPALEGFSSDAILGATSQSDGKIYGVPAWSQTMLCFYNVDIYNELGLTVPTTWAEFLGNLQVLKDNGYEPLANGTKEGWCVEFLFGGSCEGFYGANDFFNKVVAGETTFEDPAFIAAVEKMAELIPYLPDMYEGVAYTDMQSSFANELSGHFIGGSYEASAFLALNPELNLDVFAVPNIDGEPAYVATFLDMNFSMSATTKKEEAALKFLEFLATKEFGQAAVEKLSNASSVPGVDASSNPFIAKVLDLQKNSTPYIFSVGFRYEQPTGSSLFQSAGQSLMVGDITAADLCKTVQEGIAAYYKPFQK